MAYNIPFSFNPSRNQSFDPAKAKIDDLNQTGIGINDNPYVPTCDNASLLVKDNYRGIIDNYTQNFGMKIAYYSTGFSIENHNKIYGEDTTAKYRGPRFLKAIIDFSTYSSFLTKFGMMSDLEIIIYVPIKAFQSVWGNVIPLNGDLFEIVDSSCDRPLGQDPIVFEITEKHDSINTVDFMGGHYVWKLSGKRYDNSYEPGAPQENLLGGPVEDTEYGKTDSTIDQTIVVQGPNLSDVDEQAKEDFNSPSDSVYGKYF